MLDHPGRNPTADQSDETTVADLRTALGEHFTQAWALSRSDPLAAAWIYHYAYHIKVAVQDHRRVWLSSGNWNNSNQPDINPVTTPADADPARNHDRDWHVVIDNPDLAAQLSSPQRMRRHGSESQDPRRRKRAAHRGSDRNHDLSADSALLEQPHGVGRLVERIAPVHARDDLAVFDEAGEPFEVGGALFRHEQHQTLPQEG